MPLKNSLVDIRCMFISPSTIQPLIGEQLIDRAIGGDTMDRFLHYVVNAIHCLKWWATYDGKRKVELKAKLVNATLEKNSSSSPPSAKMRKKMENLLADVEVQSDPFTSLPFFFCFSRALDFSIFLRILGHATQLVVHDLSSISCNRSLRLNLTLTKNHTPVPDPILVHIFLGTYILRWVETASAQMRPGRT